MRVTIQDMEREGRLVAGEVRGECDRISPPQKFMRPAGKGGRVRSAGEGGVGQFKQHQSLRIHTACMPFKKQPFASACLP